MPFEMLSACLIDPIQALLSGKATANEASKMAQEGAEKWRSENPNMVEIYTEWGRSQR